jgi:hypothetical protein
LDTLAKSNTEEHARIEVQTSSTNGKVADLVKWRYLMTGVIAVIGVLVTGIIIPIVVAFLLKALSLN